MRVEEGYYSGEFLVWEADSRYSRENITVRNVNAVRSGTLLAYDSGTNEYFPMAATDTFAAIAFETLPEGGSGSTVRSIGIVRDAIVTTENDRVVFPSGATSTQIETITAALEAAGIIIRD